MIIGYGRRTHGASTGRKPLARAPGLCGPRGGVRPPPVVRPEGEGLALRGCRGLHEDFAGLLDELMSGAEADLGVFVDIERRTTGKHHPTALSRLGGDGC